MFLPKGQKGSNISETWELYGGEHFPTPKTTAKALIVPGEISITSDMQVTPTLWQKVKRTKEPLDESERRVKKLA